MRLYEENSRLKAPYSISRELAPCYFNITEDWNIDEYISTEYDYDVDDTTTGLGGGAKRPESEAMLESSCETRCPSTCPGAISTSFDAEKNIS